MPFFEKKDILSVVYCTLVTVGLILCIVGMFAYNSSMSMLTICGYSCILGGLLLIMGSLASKLNKLINNRPESMSAFQAINILRINIFPLLFIFITLALILSVTIQNKDKIDSGRASRNYYLFMNLNIIILCLEAYVLTRGGLESKDRDNGKTDEFKSIPLMYSTFTYFLWLFNLLFCIIQYNELTYFTTDG